MQAKPRFGKKKPRYPTPPYPQKGHFPTSSFK